MTDNNSKKRMIGLEINNNGRKVTYNGRLLGLITANEYAALIEKAELRNKITNVATTKISDFGAISNVSNSRLAMVVKNRDGADIINRTLFITEPLSYICEIDYNRKSMSFHGSKGSYITVEEV